MCSPVWLGKSGNIHRGFLCRRFKSMIESEKKIAFFFSFTIAHAQNQLLPTRKKNTTIQLEISDFLSLLLLFVLVEIGGKSICAVVTQLTLAYIFPVHMAYHVSMVPSKRIVAKKSSVSPVLCMQHIVAPLYICLIQKFKLCEVKLYNG